MVRGKVREFTIEFSATAIVEARNANEAYALPEAEMEDLLENTDSLSDVFSIADTDQKIHNFVGEDEDDDDDPDAGCDDENEDSEDDGEDEE